MKRFLFLFTAAVLSCVIFASCRTGGGNSGTSPNDPIDISESVSENEDVSGSGNSGGNISEDESDDREEGLFYITLDYRGFDDKNEVKKNHG